MNDVWIMHQNLFYVELLHFFYIKWFVYVIFVNRLISVKHFSFEDSKLVSFDLVFFLVDV